MPKLTVYSKPDRCVQCDAVKRWLDQRKIEYHQENALDHMDYLATLGLKQMPIVVTEDGNAFSGFDINKLQQYAAGH